MKVSVVMVTYGHEKFIAQAIEGVLMQQCDFPVELIIANDASPDGTDAIIKGIITGHPNGHIINYIKREANLGMMPNFISAVESVQGQYIALCEGDDYWIDANKLQKQVDFLDLNPDYSMCFHGVYKLVGEQLSESDFHQDVDKTYSILDVAEKNFIQTPSVVFRNNQEKFPEWFYQSPVGDYVLHMINAHRGLIKYFASPMAVYRTHLGGMWSMKPKKEILANWHKVLNFLLSLEFSEEVKEQLRLQRLKYSDEHLNILIDEDLSIFLGYLKIYTDEDPELSARWLFNYYPERLKAFRDSRSYKLARRISDWRNKLLSKK